MGLLYRRAAVTAARRQPVLTPKLPKSARKRYLTDVNSGPLDAVWHQGAASCVRRRIDSGAVAEMHVACKGIGSGVELVRFNWLYECEIHWHQRVAGRFHEFDELI